MRASTRRQELAVAATVALSVTIAVIAATWLGALVRCERPRSALKWDAGEIMLIAIVLIGLVIGGLVLLDVGAARLGVDPHRTEHVDWTSPEPILWL